MCVEPTSGSHSDDVLGQPLRAGQGRTQKHAELVDTRSLQAKEVRHDQGGNEREPRRFDDETGTKDRIVYRNHGLKNSWDNLRGKKNYNA